MAFPLSFPINYSSSLCVSGSRFLQSNNTPSDYRKVSSDDRSGHGILRERPKSQEYSSFAARNASFNGWESKNVSACNLAHAGFYYTGIKDYVRCFFCGGGIKDWESGDNPISEHARWYPTCALVKQYMNTSSETLPAESAHSSNFTQQCSALYEIRSSRMVLAVQNVNQLTNESENHTRRNLGDFQGAGDSRTEMGTLLDENLRLKEQKLCKICLDKEANILFLPCGHLVACIDCATALSNCAVCRAVIHSTLRVYQS